MWTSSAVQVIGEHAWLAWPAWLAYLVGSLVRGAFRSRTAASLDRAAAWQIDVGVVSRTLRQQGVPKRKLDALLVDAARKHLGVRDPPAQSQVSVLPPTGDQGK